MKNVKDSVIELTKIMSEKEKFAFINVSKSSIIGLSKKSEKPFPQFISKQIIRAINLNDPRVMKSVSSDLANEIMDDRYNSIGIKKNHRYYTPNLFEYYLEADRSIFNCIIKFFIQNTPSLIVTLHDYKRINNILGVRSNVISINYHGLYKKFDEVYGQIEAMNGKIQYCLLDCSSLGLALSPNIWENLDMSIIDFGKALNFAREYNTAAKNELS
jgi:hypothetical protein